MLSLSQIPKNKTIKIKSLRRLNPEYRQQLQAVGIVPNAELTVLRRAPLGDPIQINVNNTSLSLRQKEANAIEIWEQ